MCLRCLVLCHDVELQRTLGHALEQLEIRPEIPACWHSGIEAQQFNAVAVDFDDPRAREAFQGIRRALDKKALALALLTSAQAARGAFDAGAHFVFYKPLAPEQATHCLRAAKSLMYPSTRRDLRKRIHRPIQLSFGEANGAHAVILDLSSGGMAIHMLRPVEQKRAVTLHFRLPGSNAPIEASGEFAWADTRHRAGIRFLHLPHSSHQKLQEWLFSASA